MEAGRRLDFVVIVAVILLFCGFSEARNPCFDECFKDCTSPYACRSSPGCIASCGFTCAVDDTCKHSIRKVLPPKSVKPEEDVAVEIQSNPAIQSAKKTVLTTAARLRGFVQLDMEVPT